MAEQLRGIKSFVLRAGRLTPGQDRALKQHWPVFGRTTSQGLFDVKAEFPTQEAVHMEIGFGMGDSLARQAKENPGTGYIGIEVHKPGLGHLLKLMEEEDLLNLRLYAQDSLEVLEASIAENSLDRVQIFFPDPWPKKRHHKRRIINRPFIRLLERKLKPGGIVHIATDWQHYADEVSLLFESEERFAPVTPPARPGTKFEARGLKLGHSITDLAYQLVA